MARHIPGLAAGPISASSTTVTVFFFIIAVFAIYSVISFLCSSNKHVKSRRYGAVNISASSSKEKKLISNFSNISCKALLMAKMISWRKGEDEEEDEEAIWKKTILMGDRCRPLNFSGKIVYDSEGNRLPESVDSAREDDHKALNTNGQP